jgi:hypothetical protein
MTAPASKLKDVSESPPQSLASTSSRSRHRRSGILPFILVVSAILLGGTWLVAATWNYFWKSSAPAAWQLVPLVLTVVFIGATILARGYSNVGLRLAYRLSAIWLGALSLGFVAALACWIAALALSPFQVPSKMIAVVLFGAAVLASVYGVVNAFWLRVTRVTIPLPNLPPAWRGRSVALITDLHLGNVRGAGLSRRVVKRLQELKPEAVFISGDLFDGSLANYDALIESWKNFSVPGGIYFVTGNHEEFTARAQFVDSVRRAGIRVLDNEKVDVNGLQIVGVHDGELHDPEIYRTLLRRAALDRNRSSILLAHQPIHLTIPAEEGISLELCGHTHGGQMWPWTWVARRVHRQFNHGLNRLGKMLVLTSYGVGTWGAPMRVGTKSEIVLIRLDSAAP